jgi:uncharacterized protein (TIGR03382 family)
MKMAALIALGAIAGAANADVTYTDSQNELFDNGFGHLDIASVTVGHDAANLYFTLTLRSSVDATTWGKYCIGIDSPNASVNSSGNGWGRNVNWNGQGIDFWAAAWVDNGGSDFGGELRGMTNSGNNDNNLLAATYSTPGISGSAIGDVVMFSLSRSTLGLNEGDTFRFDVLTTGSGADPGVDHLSRLDQSTSGWGVTSVAGEFLSYTIPTPGSAALLGLGALAVGRRRR